MTSRERVLCAFEHRQPDRVPVDFGGTSTSMIHCSVVAGLRDYYGLEKRLPRINDMSTMTAYVEPDLAQCLGCDVRQLDNYGDTYGHTNTAWKEWFYHDIPVLIPADCTIGSDGKGGDYVYPQGDASCAPSGHRPAGSYYFDNLTRSPAFDEDEADPLDNAADYLPVSEAQIAHHRGLLEEAKAGEYFINVGPSYMGLGDANNIPGPNLKDPRGIRDIADWYTAPLLYPDYVHQVFELGVERSIENLQRYKDAFGEDIHMIAVCGTDFGTQRGPIMSPAVIREFYLPYYKQINRWIHENTNWKSYKHCCGSIFEIIPIFIEAGFDALNPVQCSAEGMDPRRLKETYGRDILFWGGGVDTQHVLPFGTPEEVRRQVLERLEVFSKDGGYVFNTVHNIQANTPIENIVAMVDALQEFNGGK